LHRWYATSWKRDRQPDAGALRQAQGTCGDNDSAHEVVDGVIEIPIGYVNAYAVVVDDGVVLIDTGLPGRADKVARAVVAARRRIGDVHTILLTHWHPDHVGGVADLRRRSRARIVAHGIDAPVISGEENRSSKRLLRRRSDDAVSGAGSG
jgi:glyoxylase-like metal-dependent hydrolase (beta-lactamase superfamily II)